MGDLEASLDGLGDAARALGGLASPGHPLPFVSGNVSLYNQVGKTAIPPSPIVMCSGVVRDVSTLLGQGLRRSGHVLVLVGEPRDGLDGSAYRREILRERGGPPPALSLEHEARLQAFAVSVAEGRWAAAAHDVSDGGLAVTLAEMLLAAPPEAGLGAEVNVDAFEVEAAIALFSERPAIVYEVSFERLPRLSQAAREAGLVAWPIGTVTAQPALRVLLPASEQVTWDAAALREAAGSGLRKRWNEEGV
jgi:phosphoribosylformylglycinamidine synthase